MKKYTKEDIQARSNKLKEISTSYRLSKLIWLCFALLVTIELIRTVGALGIAYGLTLFEVGRRHSRNEDLSKAYKKDHDSYELYLSHMKGEDNE